MPSPYSNTAASNAASGAKLLRLMPAMLHQEQTLMLLLRHWQRQLF